MATASNIAHNNETTVTVSMTKQEYTLLNNKQRRSRKLNRSYERPSSRDWNRNESRYDD